MRRLQRCGWTAALFIVAVIPLIGAEEPEPRTAEPARPEPVSREELDRLIRAYLAQEKQERPAEKPQAPQFDPATVSAGQAAFQANCTKCHDANRALEKSKDLAGWRATVRRMANRQGANIPASDWEPIAVYLASLSADGAAPGAAATSTDQAAAKPASGGTIQATLAPVFRGGEQMDRIENHGFFPETWVGAEFHTGKGLSARVMGCVTCHREGPINDRVALVEGVIRLDLKEWLECPPESPGVAVEMGRFIVPFSATAAQSHPGAQRLVTKPLLFNMGQNVDRPAIGPAVLPMPYSDEGLLLNASIPLGCELTATLDFYLVNGLIGNTDGVNFYASRDYMDNNSQPAIGARAALGHRFFQVGGSATSGRFNDHSGTGMFDHGLDYQVVGVDAILRYEDLLRVQAEYAIRETDRFLLLPDRLLGDDELYGYSVEGELRLCQSPRIGVVARYDTLTHHGDLPPSGSTLTATRFSVYRFTWGFTIALPGGSLLLINHERWNLPDELKDVDVLGVRWVASF